MRPSSRPCLLLVLAMAVAGAACRPTSVYGPVDLSGSSLVVLPANLAACDPGIGAVHLQLRDAAGTPLTSSDLEAQLVVRGCRTAAAWTPVDVSGHAVMALSNCTAGLHTVQAQLRAPRIAAFAASVAASVNAYTAVAASDASTVPAGTPLSFAIQAPPDFVGAVVLRSSDPNASLPTGITVTPADHGVVTLERSVVLASLGTQLVQALSAVDGRVLAAAQFIVGPPAGATGAPLASASYVSVAPPLLVADGTMTATITVTLRDAAGQAVAGELVQLAVTGSDNALDPISARTGEDGVAVAHVASTVAEAKTVTASFAGGSASSQVTFVAAGAAVAPAASTSTSASLTSSAAAVTADGVTPATLTFRLLDAGGGPVAGAAVALACSGASNVLTPAAASTDAQGEVAATLRSTVAEAKTLVATYPGGSAVTTVSFVPGPVAAATSALDASPATAVADGSTVVALTATFRDALGNLLAGAPVTLTGGGGASLVPTSGVTAADGTWHAQMTSTTAGSTTVTATAGGQPVSTSVSFVSGPATAPNSTLAALPTSAVADGLAGVALTLTLRDAQGNPVANHLVTWSGAHAGQALTPSVGITAADGRLTTTLSGTVAGDVTLSATDGTVTLSQLVHLVAGPAAVARSQLRASPAAATADGVTPVTVTASVVDAQGNPVAGETVNFACAGAGTALAPASAATLADGTATTALTGTAVAVQTVTATVAAGSLPPASATFVPGPPAAGPSSLGASPGTVVANGVSATALGLVVRDAQSHPVPGIAVTFGASGSSNLLAPTAAVTAADGSVAATFASTVAEGKTVTATFGGQSLTAPVTFTAPQAGAATSQLSVTPAQVGADNVDQATLQLVVRDAAGQPMAAVPVTLTGSGAGNTFTPASGVTAANGTFGATLRTSVLQLQSLTATFAGTRATALLSSVNGVVASLSGPTLVNNTAILGLPTALRVSAYDALGHAVAFSPPLLHFTATDASATVPADFPMLQGNAGVVTTAVTFNTPGTWQVGVVASNPGSAAASATFVVDRATLPARSISNNSMCATLSSGRLKCWGYNGSGTLGLGDTASRGQFAGQMGAALPAVALGTGRSVVAVSEGSYQTCSLLDDATIKCWGNNSQGLLGQGDTSSRGASPGSLGDALPAISLGTGRTAREVAAGFAHTCARLDDNSVKCWGSSIYGQLGVGDTTARGTAPAQMGDGLPGVALGTGRSAVAIAPSYYATCALLDNGQVKCWGYNPYGNLGIGDTVTRGTAAGQMGDALPPVALGTGRTATALAGSTYSACAILDDATLKCWGYNASGQLGQGDISARGTSPAQMGDGLPAVSLGTGRTALSVAMGTSHTCALLDDHSVKCWGSNAQGQLGQGDTASRGNVASTMGDLLSRVSLGTGRTATAIACSANSSCASLDDGSIKCWGDNSSGELGLGDSLNRGTQLGQMGDALPGVVLW